MKPSIAVLYVLVSLCLVFSLTALLLEASDRGFFAQSPPSNTNLPTVTAAPPTNTPAQTTHTPTPTPATNTPKPTAPNTDLTITYDETSREESGDRAKVTLTVTATYHSGGDITIDYAQFYLQLYAPRMGYFLNDGTTNYPNSGTLAIGPHHTTQTFQLTYEYGTKTFNGMDPATTYYQLQCNSTTTINWANQTYHR